MLTKRTKDKMYECDLCVKSNFVILHNKLLLSTCLMIMEDNKNNTNNKKKCKLCSTFAFEFHIINEYHYNAFYRINYCEKFNDSMDVCQLFNCNTLYSNKCDCKKKHEQLIIEIINYMKEL